MTITSLGPPTQQFTQKILQTKNQGNIEPEPEKVQESVELSSFPHEPGNHYFESSKFIDKMLPENREAYKKNIIELGEKCFFKGATLQDAIDNWELLLKENIFLNLGGKKILTEDDFKNVEEESAQLKKKMVQIAKIKNYQSKPDTNNTPLFNQKSSNYNYSSQIENSLSKNGVYKSFSTQILKSYKKNQEQILSLYKKWTA